MIRIQGTRIMRTESLCGSKRLPKFIVMTQRGDSMHFMKRTTAVHRAKLHRAGGIWRVKAK